MPQTWALDPKTGDYMIDDQGRPIETNDLTVAAYIRLKGPRVGTVKRDGSPGGWMYAPNAKWGSTFWTLKTQRSSAQDAAKIENIAAAALQPLADSGRAISIDVTTVFKSRTQQALQTVILETNGTQSQLELPSLGV